MSDQDLWTVLGRARSDLDFSGKLIVDLDAALQADHYALTDGEKQKVRQALVGEILPSTRPGSTPSSEDAEFQRRNERERVEFTTKRAKELGQYAVDTLKETLHHSAATYRAITIMNQIMFITGIVMFVAGSVSAVVYRDRTIYSLMLAGLGAANYISIFMLGAIEKTQVALSNLVQVEVAFMTFFEQVSFWEAFALMPKGSPPMPDPANIEKASLMLQQRSGEIMELLQTFVEDTRKSRKSRVGKVSRADTTN